MVQPWAELYVAGVGFSFANLDGCHFPMAFVLMLDMLYTLRYAARGCLPVDLP